MNKLYLILFLVIMLAFPLNSNASNNEIPVDKRLHGLCGYVISDILHDKLGLSGLELFLWFNVIGISKELLDQAHGGDFDTNDLVANNIGYLCYNCVRLEW